MKTRPFLGRTVVLNVDTPIAGKLNQLAGRRYNVGDPCAGIVTRVLDNNACNLTLFPDAEEILHVSAVPFSSGNQPGTWTWTEEEATGMGATAEAA
jgi:hypothetical protein